MHPAAVCGLAHLGCQPFDDLVKSGQLVFSRGLGANHRALAANRDLHPGRLVGKPRVQLPRNLHIDPNDAMVVLLQLGQFLLDLPAEPV